MVSGRLTTHVLDTATGQPAGGIEIEVWRVMDGDRELLRTVVTNADGRTDGPLLEGGELVAGMYELVFAVGAYFAARGFALPNPLFLDRVPVRFGVADPAAHYHVPLLTSPWAYSSYRGS